MGSTIIFFVFISLMFSCTTDDIVVNNEILLGRFVEITPESSRFILNFESETFLEVINDPSQGRSTFSIRQLEDGRLDLSCNECDQVQPIIVTYRILNNNSFEIGGSFLPTQDELLIFEREE